MFDAVIEKVLLLLILLFLITGILYFIFYPAIVNYRKCRTNNGNVITLTTMIVVNSDGSQNNEGHSIIKVKQELDANFTIKDLTNPTTKLSSTDAVNVEPPILSIVIPAYDEEQRLPTMLHTAYSYLNQTSCPAMQELTSILPSSTKRKASSSSSSDNNNHSNECYDIECIVVNDGSKDQTSLAYETFIQQNSVTSNSTTKNMRMLWKLVSFSKNCGKGAAVQAGMMIATGQFRLMVDADGATDFGPGLQLLIQRLKQEMIQEQPTISTSSNAPIEFPIIFGSRAHVHHQSSSNDSSQQEQQQKRSVIRSFLMQAFHVCVMLLVGNGGGGSRSKSSKKRRTPIVDTQCGFKLFPADAAQRLFAILHLQRWAFDIELVYIIQSLLDYDCIEVVVPWKEIDGSKLATSPYNLAIVAVCMLRDMICVRLCYTFGIWNIKATNPESPPVLSYHQRQEEQQQIVKKDR